MKSTILKPIILSSTMPLILTMLFCLFSIAIAAQEGTKKKKARISLEYIKINEVNRHLKATVKTKIDRSYQKVGEVEVKFYLDEAIDDNLLGSIESDDNGQAIIELPKDIEILVDSTFQYTFIATIENNPNFLDNEKKLIIKESKFEFDLEEEDSLKKVNVFLGTPDSTGNIVPTEEVNVKLYVERMYGDLLISEDFEMTDEDGKLSFDFPANLPGDRDGNLVIVARIEENDDFGTLAVEKMMPWGIPVTTNERTHKRELWAAKANTPIYLVIIINGMVIGIWGTIIYIIFQIGKIRKIGKNST